MLQVFVFEGHPLDSLWERDVDALQLRNGVGYFDSEPRENPGFPADVVERELGHQRPRLLERQLNTRRGDIIHSIAVISLENL